ncbi:hypothetical protein GCM10011581_28910 [Saccharopolyspora subtropica]|uniref:Uncharacterized protein n=1 Tax=Saccharopolyspora thermophila TaxID=89367 RepID=A0A917NDJ0_9PSEU|nr:hypothetical protein [Saccharopolyspora subtropica]GGI90034.1 hypothetical protein GCM10011581_28910 [Saccharopolyspora subtropica]
MTGSGHQHDGHRQQDEATPWLSAEYAAEVRDRGRRHGRDRGAPAEAMELHICMGLSACKGLDADGNAYMAGTGTCATVEHVCHGEGHCRGQGGCGYHGGDYQQFYPGAQACRFNGSCASPVNVSRVFSAGPLKGKSVWKQARRLFEARMHEANLAFGPSPGEGIPDDMLPRYDVMRDEDIPPHPAENRTQEDA